MARPSLFNCFVVGMMILLLGLAAFSFVMLLTLLPVLLWFVIGLPVASIVVGYVALQFPFIRKEFWLD